MEDRNNDNVLAVRPNVLPSTAQFAMMRELAERLAYAEGFLPRHFFQGDPQTRKHRILAAIEYGRAVGIEPMIALQNITMIDGKASASALLIGALVRRGGYEIESEVEATGATVTIRRNGKITGTGEFTLVDAKRAGLLREGSGWTKYPRDMLYARALTQAARQGAQDAMLGLAYTSEELGLEIDEDGQVSGEIAPKDASSESRAAYNQAATPQAVQAVSIPSQSEATTPQPAPSAAPHGPRAKRGNVIAAPQAAEKPVTAVEAPASPTTQTPATPRQDAPPPLALDALDDDPGRAAYEAELRHQARQLAAVIRRLQVMRQNADNAQAIALGTAKAAELPLLEPNPAADQALAEFINKPGVFPGRSLADLEEAELSKILPTLEAIVAKLNGLGFKV